ncbi:MAG: hypothetical protein BMS9Abin34_047 [Patescibacteria group bacterium]|nr:MAG: hypothetical protein BMS9Abin34_047 [Patescibacteria group bacterium]
MLSRLVSWIKNNKIAAVLFAALLGFILIGGVSGFIGVLERRGGSLSRPGYEGISLDYGISGGVPVRGGVSTSKDRLVVEESNLSLVVEDVRSAADEVVVRAESEGGFMVSSSLTSPEESPVAVVIVRVPTKKFKEAVEYYRSLAVKVSSENLLGTDVTKEYEDIDSRIKTIEKTIGQLEEIKAKAAKVSDLISITRQITSLQEQIDSLKGRKEFLEQSAAFPKITVYLASDELALPYQPAEGFRPGVVFKLAVRSLLTGFYAVGRALIWIGVYGIIWIPALVIFIFLAKRKKRSS